MLNNDAPIPGTTITAPLTRRDALSAPIDPATLASVGIPDPIPVNANPSVVDWFKSIAKCILAVFAIIVGMLLSILQGKQTLADVTFVEWLWIASYVLMAGGLVWRTPNKTL